MINDKNIDRDNKLKDLFSASKIKASDNLQFRVMQQIATEHSLVKIKRKEQRIGAKIKSVTTLIGVMYGLIAVCAVFAFLYGGRTALLSQEFIMSVVSITAVSTAFGLINILEMNRLNKKHQKDKV